MCFSLRYDFQCSEYVATLQCVVNRESNGSIAAGGQLLERHILTIKEVAIAATYRSITKFYILSTDRRSIYVFIIIFSTKRVYLSVKH
jgi:hypothetical protein